MTEYFVLKKIPTGDTKVPLAEAIADLGYVHIESVAAMLEERKKQKDDQDRATPADPWILQKQLTDCKQQVASLRRSLRIKADRTKDAREAENDAITLLEKVMAERDQAQRERDTHAGLRATEKEERKVLEESHDQCLDMLDEALAERDANATLLDQARKDRDEAIADRNYARRECDMTENRRHQVMEARDEALRRCTKLRKERNDAVKASDRSCLSCGSSDYVWYFNNGESAYCSECKRGPAPPPPFKAIPCPSCGRKLMADGVLSGTCCICGTDLALPTCPHCGNDTFMPRFHMKAMFTADGVLCKPDLYNFVCSKCQKEVGTLPLKAKS